MSSPSSLKASISTEPMRNPVAGIVDRAIFGSLNAPVTDSPIAPESTAIAATRPTIVVFEFIEVV